MAEWSSYLKVDVDSNATVVADDKVQKKSFQMIHVLAVQGGNIRSVVVNKE